MSGGFPDEKENVASADEHPLSGGIANSRLR
jgi:hypothetical protein